MQRDEIDQVFRSLARPLWILTSADGDHRAGLLATWVLPCSLAADRPFLLVALAPLHATTSMVEQTRSFCAHLLTARNLALGLRFGLTSGPDPDKFAGLDCVTTTRGLPRIQELATWLECRVVDDHSTGDRRYFWAEVVDGATAGNEPAATDHDLLDWASPAERAQLRDNLRRDIELLRPLRDVWCPPMTAN